MKLFIGSDHRGFSLKEEIKSSYSLMIPQIIFEDVGCKDQGVVDYPNIVASLAGKMQEMDRAVLICGSGIGMSIAANRYSKFRAALCFTTQITERARKHNDTNILVLGAEFIEPHLAVKLVEIFINTAFEGGRHQKRLSMMKHCSE
jgi:ribose 5-phosphate isomerase B